MARCYRALGHPGRLRLLDMLQGMGEEIGVEELSVRLEVPRPMLSKQLKTLCEVGLVERRRVGRMLLHSARPSAVKPMLDAVALHVATHFVAAAQGIEPEALQRPA